MNLEELECHLIELRSKNMNTRGVLRRLLQEYCRVKAFDRALEVAQVSGCGRDTSFSPILRLRLLPLI